jgi:hypothetical protein
MACAFLLLKSSLIFFGENSDNGPSIKEVLEKQKFE